MVTEDASGEQPREAQFQIVVTPELEGGVYSNFLAVWHTPFEFTLDFASTQPPQLADPEDPESPVTVPCRVVSRVKIPTAVLFDVLRALNENMTRYEATFGEIQRLEGRGPEQPGQEHQ